MNEDRHDLDGEAYDRHREWVMRLFVLAFFLFGLGVCSLVVFHVPLDLTTWGRSIDPPMTSITVCQ